MRRSIEFVGVLMALVAMSLALAGCNNGSSGDSKTYTVSFDANGGSGSMASVTVEEGAYPAPSSIFTGPSYIPPAAGVCTEKKCFVGWNTAADGSGRGYATGATITIGSDVKLYAQWAKPVFSVSATERVHFSKGNLYCSGSTWNFEANQYDTTPTASGTWDTSHVSHFHWSKEASVAYAEGYSDSGATTSDVLFTNATETTPKADFTVNGVTGKYRALSRDEWQYLFNVRENATALRGAATVCGVHGYVILPDGWTLPGGSTFTSGNGSGWNTNIYADSAAWNVMETAGAVFLPAAGDRGGTSVNYVGGNGYYWSSTANYSDNAYYLGFGGSGVNPANNISRSYGYAVRLVCGEN